MNGPLNWSSLVKFESQVRSISGRMRLVNTNLMKIKTVLGVTNYSFKRRMRLLRNELKTAESNLAKVEAKFKTAVDLGSDILQRLSSNSQLNGGETSSEVNPHCSLADEVAWLVKETDNLCQTKNSEFYFKRLAVGAKNLEQPIAEFNQQKERLLVEKANYSELDNNSEAPETGKQKDSRSVICSII